MSVWTQFRNSVETSVAGYAQGYGLNITPSLAVSAGGTPSANTAAPSGAVSAGAPNTNPSVPSIFGSHTLLIVGAAILLVILFVVKRR